ncbi:alpha/beta hydrolase [Litchfieldella anticariensis FP35 = DSM 16096]|uniref:Alpha/beta hydrolase n=1 Tax=Litchfieldella anticariensis (strain DSM 16096 / CECT 5854 / CIP 108499 / LMG 22089 / FP35) TaxID=1121939 RepID=S2KV18_LITA3|nr:hydrolase [Halomonas anticariensis]EPC04398.1 alpha/beta hydrolase [Halomonas anticariensis FP35 = DSM 16096]
MSRTIVPADFRAPRGLSNRHVQTLLPRLLPKPRLARETEILNLPDGDFVELAWVRPAPLRDDAPLFLLFHGLEGSFDSPYARALLGMASRRGWRAVMMHFRGCGQAPNRLPRAYHSGDTADAYWLIGQLAQRYPHAIKVAAGVSLGANMLVKLVAEQGGDGLDLAGAIAISAPLDLAASADALNSGFSRFYQRRLLESLKRKVSAKMVQGPLPISLSPHQLKELDSFWAYDNEVTAPLHGFSSASDYYQRASAGRLIGDIELPTLILHAADDPFMPGDLFDRLPTPSDAVRVEIARQGGHVGFIAFRRGRLRSWLVQRVARQLDDWATLLPATSEWLRAVPISRSDN